MTINFSKSKKSLRNNIFNNHPQTAIKSTLKLKALKPKINHFIIYLKSRI